MRPLFINNLEVELICLIKLGVVVLVFELAEGESEVSVLDGVPV